MIHEQDSFIWFVKQYSKQIITTLRDNSHCYIFSDWRKYKDVQIAFETNGLELRALIVWNKKNGMGEFWRSVHEFILFFTKRHPKKLNHGSCFNVVEYKSVKSKRHPAEKPVDLISFLIEASSRENDLILDPFIGSGTTVVACEKLNRRWIGIEISKKYCEIAKQRIKNESDPIKLL